MEVCSKSSDIELRAWRADKEMKDFATNATWTLGQLVKINAAKEALISEGMYKGQDTLVQWFK